MNKFNIALPYQLGMMSESQLQDLINKVLATVSPYAFLLNPETGLYEPGADLQNDGQLAWADGSTWNPNSRGKGMYVYKNASWDKLLGITDQIGGLKQVFKYKASTPVQSVDTGNILNGDTDLLYFIFYRHISGVSGANGVFLGLNNDFTAANYAFVQLYGDGTVAASNKAATAAGIAIGHASGSMNVISNNITVVFASRATSVMGTISLFANHSNGFVGITQYYYTIRTSNLTRAVFSATVASGIGADTEIEILTPWR